MPTKEQSTFQLSELTGFIRRVFALNLPQAVWVAAEIGQANVSRDHTWLTLVQKEKNTSAIIAQLEGVVWKGQMEKLRRAHGLKLLRNLFQDGMSVRLKVTASFHQRYGLRLVVEDIDPGHTIGELELKRRVTLEHLAAQNLLRKNAEQVLSPVPLRLAVVSSDTAAGLADFRNQLQANSYGYQFKLRLFPAAMQGTRTGPEVMSRLRQIKAWPEAFDAVVIVRGGGGRTDLAAFDDGELAESIANYPLPVITGIGHETDDTVVDRVAHTALKTPTAAAVFLIDRVAHAESALVGTARTIWRHGSFALSHERTQIRQLSLSVEHAVRNKLYEQQSQLNEVERSLRRIPQLQIREADARINALERLLTAMRPETTLARGYAMVTQDGRLISSAEQLEAGEVGVRFQQGRATLRVPDKPKH